MSLNPTKNRRRTPLDQKLLVAAGDLFYRRGYNAVSVNEIAAEAKVTKVTLYRHFLSKDSLAAVWLADVAKGDRRRLERIAERMPNDPLGQLRAIVADVAEQIAAPGYRGWCSSNLVVELTDPAHPLRKLADAHKASLREHLLSLTTAARAPQPRSLADFALLLLEGAAVSRQAFAGEGPSDCLIEAFEALLAQQGLTAGAKPPTAEPARC